MLKINKQTITLTKGDDASLRLVPRYKDRTEYVLTEGDSAVFRIKFGHTLVELQCTLNLETNKIVANITPNDTKDFNPGIYRYEAELITSFGFHYTFIADQTFILGQEYEQRITSTSNGNGTTNGNLPEIDGIVDGEPVVYGDIQPTNPMMDYEELNHLPKLNGITIKGDKDNEYYGIPTKLSEMDNDDNYVQDEDYQHTDNNYDDTAKNAVDALGTASTYDVPESGNASTSQVVKGDDTRLTDSRNPNPHTHSKADITDFPTNVSAFNNDSGFITNTVNNLANYYLKTETYTRAEVEQLIAAIKQGKFEIVAELPASGDANVIYLVPKSTAQTSNSYDEYVYINNAWEKIGDTDIDLSGYVTDDELTTALQSYLTTSAFNTAIANYYTKTEVGNFLDNKVDKVAGKGLSTNDYDNTAKGIVDGVTSALNDKVDKVQGKGLSTNDYDNTAKGIVDGVTSALADKVDKVNGKGLSTEDYTTAEKSKLGDISDNAKKVASSSTNGHIEIDDVDTTVYDDTAVTTAIDNIEDELSTDYATVEGNPINFSTLSAQKSKSTILSVEPIQDLHGYDKPWVGGAGKNLVVPKEAGTYTSADVTIIMAEDGTFSAYGQFSGTAFLGYPVGALTLPAGTYKFNGQNGADSTNHKATLQLYNLGTSIQITNLDNDIDYEFTLSETTNLEVRFGRRVGFNIPQSSPITMKPMVRLASIADSSFEPYENICPITGRTEIGILGCGKNMLNPNISMANGYYNDDGDLQSSTRTGHSELLKTNPNTNYTLKLKVNWQSTRRFGFYFWDENKNWISRDTVDLVDSIKLSTITPSNCKYISLQLMIGDGATDVGFDISQSQLELGNQATTYSPYTKSNDLTISLGQTVYGGTLDVENGVLVVEDGKKKINDLSWTYDSTNTRFSAIGINYKGGTVRAVPILSSSYECVDDGRPYGQEPPYCIFGDATRIMIKDARYTDATTFESEMGNEDICYKLANPITINLTPHTINLLKGVNNISTDGDKITLTYRDGKFATLDGAVPKMTFRGEDYTMGVDDIGLFLENLTKSTKTYIADPLLNFDGTVATYKKIMKQWFINNGVNIMDSTGITYLCERWYEITKQGWKGGTSFPQVGVSTGSTGTRFDDNVGMSVTPSTDTSANTDTYQGLPLFAITDCNWELDSDGNILITAIDGITDNFVRDDPTKFVGVMQQTGWVKKVDDASTQKYYYADDKDAYEDLVPLPEAIKLDGTVRSFVVHAKYMSGIVDSKMTCCAGVIPRRNISHDSLVTLPDNIGTQYSGGTSVDWSFLVWMQRIKYASLTSDGVLQGCCNYNYQYYVKVSETGVKRLILSSANGANLKVGSTVTFGAYAGNADRGQAATYSISGQDGAIITAIEDVTIDSTTYKAVYVNTANTFDTVANGDATNGTTIVSTHHWVSGSCDNVKGNDGSPVSATNGIYPAKLQGIEYMVGGYEVFADVIMNISGGYYNPYYARKSTDQATSITSSMVQSTLKCAQPSSDAWRYIQKHGFDGEIFYPVSTGTSSSEYMKDGFYENGTSTSTGTREWLAFGCLDRGSGNAGLSCLTGGTPLSNGWWTFVARLSCNGNRGILLTA